MAEAVQELFPGAQIAFGPATDNGYFYDFELPENISSDDFAAIEKKMAQIVKRNEPFVREVVSVEEAKEIFADQRFKLEHIDDLTEGEISVYRHGSFVDLCAGPHIPSAGKIGALQKNGTVWLHQTKKLTLLSRKRSRRITNSRFKSIKTNCLGKETAHKSNASVRRLKRPNFGRLLQ